MNVYTASFSGVWLGGFALIFAADETYARHLLDAAIAGAKLTDKQTSPPEITLRGRATPRTPAECVILWNGDY